MNHKRGRPRNSRAGCKLCAPWKINGVRTETVKGERFSDHARREAAAEQLLDHEDYGLEIARDTSPEWCGCSECWREANPEVYPLLLAFDPRFPPPEGLTP